MGWAGESVLEQVSKSSEDEGSYTPRPEDLNIPHVTPLAGFSRPDLTSFARLDGLGLAATGQRLEPERAVVACRVVEPYQWCRRCGCEGMVRDSVIRRLAHEPLGWRPTVLEVTVRRYRCIECGHVWRQDTTAAAEPRARLSRAAVRWALEGLIVAHLTVAGRRGSRGCVGYRQQRRPGRTQARLDRDRVPLRWCHDHRGR